MSLTDGSGLSASDVLALTANNNDGFGGNGFGGGWWLILFIIMMFGGWGNWGNAGAGNGVANMAVPYMLGQNSEVQRGFDQSATMNALNNLSMAVANGFGAQSVDSCNKAMTILQGQNGILNQMANDRFNTITTLNGGHNAILQQMGNYEMARQQCCCENRAAIADLKYTVATENCADRTALDTAVWNLSKQMSDGFQGIKDQMYQNKLDEKNEQILNLQRQLDQRDRAASQIAQNQFFAANNQMQTDTIMNFLNPPYARPFPPTTGTATNG